MVAVPEDLQSGLDAAYLDHFPQLYRRARRWLPADEAEDLVQETFLRAWTHHGGRDPGIAWLMTVLRNLAIDRSRRIKPHLVEDVATVETATASDTADTVVELDDRRRIRDAVRNLTESQRRALHMKEWMGLSQEEIAQNLGTTVPAVESLLLRGRRRLRGLLEGALGVAVWPLTFTWRRLRWAEQHVAAGSGGGQAAIGVWSGAIANVATATIIAVGSMQSPSAPDRQTPPGDRGGNLVSTHSVDDGASTGFGAYGGGGSGSGTMGSVPHAGAGGAGTHSAVQADGGSSSTPPTSTLPADTTDSGSTGSASGGGTEAGSTDASSTSSTDQSGTSSGESSTSGSGTTSTGSTGDTTAPADSSGTSSDGSGTSVAPPPAQSDGTPKDGKDGGGEQPAPPPASDEGGTVSGDTEDSGGTAQPGGSGSTTGGSGSTTGDTGTTGSGDTGTTGSESTGTGSTGTGSTGTTGSGDIGLGGL